MYKEYLMYYDCQYLLEDKICDLLNILGIKIDREEFITTFEDKYYPDNPIDEKVFIFLKENTQELFYLDTYIHPSDTLGMYGLGFRCKEEKFDTVLDALRASIERFEERNQVCFDLKNDCLYNISNRLYVDNNEVPGVSRLKKVEIDKYIY